MLTEGKPLHWASECMPHQLHVCTLLSLVVIDDYGVMGLPDYTLGTGGTALHKAGLFNT